MFVPSLVGMRSRRSRGGEVSGAYVVWGVPFCQAGFAPGVEVGEGGVSAGLGRGEVG